MEKHIYLVGNAHLDPVWLWRWQEGFAEIKATFKSALDRLTEYPDFTFTSACAAYYEWVEDSEPEMFEQIQKYVKEGRWIVTGGWWIQPDCNLPSGESFARHGLISQNYFLEKFGKIAVTGYNVDSFGHNGMLPQILKKSGMTGYVFHRPYDHEKTIEKNAFVWRGVDNTEINAYKIPFAYCTTREVGDVDKYIDDIELMSQKQGTDMMLFYGVGNHGGSPTRAVVEKILDRQKTDKCPIFNSIDEFFENRESDLVIQGDLQHHAAGCYAAVAEIKKNNRKAEYRAVAAEKAMVLANILMDKPYEKERMNRAWKGILFNQFHDILGGCSIKQAYDDARELHGEALSISSQLLNSALQKISWNIETMEGESFPLTKDMDWALWETENRGIPFVVFNLSGHSVKTPITVNKPVTSVCDINGRVFEIQKIRAPQTNGQDKWDRCFTAELPPMGYRVFKVFLKKEQEAAKSSLPLTATDLSLENSFVKMEFDEQNGYIKSFFDKVNKRELLKGFGAVPTVIEDEETDTWAHGVTVFQKEKGKFTLDSIKLLETGNVFATVEVRHSFNSSRLRQRFTVYRDIPQIEVSLSLNWQEELSILKLCFDTGNERTLYKIPYGYIEKPGDGQEAAAHTFAAAVDENCFGLGIYNDSRYSYSNNRGVLGVNLVRSCYFADHYGKRDDYMEPIDIGIHEIKYGISPVSGTESISTLDSLGDSLNFPPVGILETYHKGVLGSEFAGIEIENRGVKLEALKLSEKGDGFVIRLCEVCGLKSKTALSFMDAQTQLEFTPFEVKTLLLKDGEFRETDLIEREVQ